MSIANRFSGVRAVLAHNELTAVKSREHNDSNVRLDLVIIST